MIKLKSFEIKSPFKNLDNLKINFERCNGITVLIGNNGSGKSNIIEALSSVFAGLYDNHFNPTFSYELEYEKDEAVNKVKYDHTKGRNKYIRTLSDPENYLPTQIISIYSGEELRLWNRYYFKFYDDFMKAVIKSEKPYTEKQKMVFINKYYWNTALLTMLISDLDISEILGDRKIDRIEFEFKSNNISNIEKYNTQNPNDVTRFARNIFDISNETSNPEKRAITLDDFKDEIIQTHSDLFKLLSISILPREENWKLINKLELFFEDGYSTDELSEGEKKQILIKFVTRIFADDNSLLLMDEPDSHIHISNKEAIKNLLYDLEDKVHVQSILTTHSPTLTHCFDNDNVFMLVNKEGKIELEDKTKLEIINDLTSDFWNLQEQNIFNSSEMKISLFVEGKHDKEHIEKAFDILGDEYPELDFDIFNMDGATNIEHIVKGLYTSEIEHNKLYIGILDDDDEGKNVCQELTKSLKDKADFDVFMYPKKKVDRGHDGAFTVENLFDVSLYQQAYSKVLQDFEFGNSSIDKISKKIQISAKGCLTALVNDLGSKEDFKNFRYVFDRIKESHQKYEEKQASSEITDLSIDVNTETEQESTVTSVIEAEPIVVHAVEEYIDVNSDQNHQDYTKPEVWSIYQEFKTIIQTQIENIEFNSKKFYISLKKGKNFAFLKYRKNFFSVIVLASRQAVDQYISNNEIKTPSESVQGYYNGECYEIMIRNNEHLNEIVDLLEIASNNDE